jgi:aminopeptidase N
MLVFRPMLMTEQPQVFRLTGCFSAVLPNSGGTGYFHTAQAPAALAQLVSVAASRMTAAERIRLLDDQWALAAAGLSGVGDYLSVVAALSSDPAPEVIETAAQGLAFLRQHVVGEAAREAFEAWVRKTMGPVAASLGWQAARGDSEERRRLRAAVLDILGTAGRDPVVLSTARTLFIADVSGAQALDRTMRETVTRLAARTADAELLATIRGRDGGEMFTSASDGAIVVRALEEALTDAASREALPAWIAASLENPAVNGRVWTFLTSHWSELQPMMGTAFALPTVVSAAGSFCDADRREEVREFFGDKTAGTPRTLQLALDRIDACRDFRLRQEDRLAEWLVER